MKINLGNPDLHKLLLYDDKVIFCYLNYWINKFIKGVFQELLIILSTVNKISIKILF